MPDSRPTVKNNMLGKSCSFHLPIIVDVLASPALLLLRPASNELLMRSLMFTMFYQVTCIIGKCCSSSSWSSPRAFCSPIWTDNYLGNTSWSLSFHVVCSLAWPGYTSLRSHSVIWYWGIFYEYEQMNPNASTSIDAFLVVTKWGVWHLSFTRWKVSPCFHTFRNLQTHLLNLLRLSVLIICGDLFIYSAVSVNF